ncbi:MAG: M55 family metallopeptidase [Candidatus Rifleibacteriota bacterium]
MSITSSAKSVLIIADIEGSSGCLNKSDSQLFNDGWVRACVDLTLDLNAIISAIFSSGKVSRVRVKDFHRTGFNIFADLLDSRAELSQGYQSEPVMGIGECSGFDLLFLVGLHAASGTDGFLAHTLTSRFAELKADGCPLTEAELFAVSVAGHGLKPAFFSGCPEACRQVRQVMPGLTFVEVSKNNGESREMVRQKLSAGAVKAVTEEAPQIFAPQGMVNVEIKMRDGARAAEKLAKLWQLQAFDDRLTFTAGNLEEVYRVLIKLAYLTPFWSRNLNAGLRIFNLWGRLTHLWARFRRRKTAQLS